MADIHNYKRRLERTIQNIQESEISEENKRLIMRFHDYCITQGISICKIERYLYDAFRLGKDLSDLENATKDDLMQIIIKIEKKEWTYHTKHTFKVMIRKFYKFVEGIEEKGVYPERVRWIKPTAGSRRQKLPEELINEEEAEKIINHCKSERDRALISMLFESGCRIGEVGSLRIKDVSFDKFGALVNVYGKTGSRRIRLINSIPYLQEWLNKHPENQEPESYVWIKPKGVKPLTYGRLVDIIRNAAKDAGIKKRVYAHLFRHSRATILANYLTEAQMKSYMGWTQASKMAAVYVHLSGRDTDNAILKMNGIAIKEEKELSERLRAKSCTRCQTQNESTNRFCKLCGFVLDKDESRRILQQETESNNMNNLLNSLLKDEKVLQVLAEKIREKEIAK